MLIIPVLLKGRQEDSEPEASLGLHSETMFLKTNTKLRKKQLFLFSMIQMAVISEGWHAGLEYTRWLSTEVGLRKIENFLQEKKTKSTGRKDTFWKHQ